MNRTVSVRITFSHESHETWEKYESSIFSWYELKLYNFPYLNCVFSSATDFLWSLSKMGEKGLLLRGENFPFTRTVNQRLSSVWNTKADLILLTMWWEDLKVRPVPAETSTIHLSSSHSVLVYKSTAGTQWSVCCVYLSWMYDVRAAYASLRSLNHFYTLL